MLGVSRHCYRVKLGRVWIYIIMKACKWQSCNDIRKTAMNLWVLNSGMIPANQYLIRKITIRYWYRTKYISSSDEDQVEKRYVMMSRNIYIYIHSYHHPLRWRGSGCCLLVVLALLWLGTNFLTFFGFPTYISDFVQLCLTLSDFVRLCPTLSDSVQNGSQIDVGDYFTPKLIVTGPRWPRSCSRRSFWNVLIRGCSLRRFIIE